MYCIIPVLVTYKPPADVSTNPTWVKLPVETHEPNTPSSAAPIKESTTGSVYTPILMASKPTTPQTPSENDILITSNSISSVSSSTQNPSSTIIPPTVTTTTTSTTATESLEAGNVPLNMSNYKDGNHYLVGTDLISYYL